MTVQNILIVYEWIPEETNIYLVPNTESALYRLEKINGTYINSDELTEEQEEIHEWLSNKLDKDEGDWAMFKVAKRGKIGIPIISSETAIILCGFAL